MKKEKNIFKAFEDMSVLVVGDVMIDRYMTGQVNRISPEAPVPILLMKESDNRLGGAANVALNIRALGAEVYLCSVIGEDENANIMLNLLPKHQINAIGIVQSNQRKTTVKTRVIADHQQLLRVDQEDKHDLSIEEQKEMFQQIVNILASNKIDVILFQDYNKGVLCNKIIQKITKEALDRKIPITVDPKKKNFYNYKNVDLFKPNLKEVQESLPFELKVKKKSLEKASKYIREKLNNRYTLITLSDKGLFIDDGENAMVLPTHPRKIADVCGAGDSVISIVSLALTLSVSTKDIAILANLSGGQVCEHVGVVPVNKKQLEKEYSALKNRK